MAAKTHPRTWARRLALISGCILFALLSILIFLQIAMRSEPGRNYVAAKIENMQPSGQSIDISGLEGNLLGNMTIKQLEVSGKEGLWLRADHVRITWSPLKLLTGVLQINDIFAAKVDVLDQPQLEKTNSKGGLRPRGIVIEAVKVPAFRLAETLLPEEQTLTIFGSASMGAQGGALQLIAKTSDETSRDSIDADITWSPEYLISGDAQVKSLPGGIIATLLRLQSDEVLALDMTSTGQRRDLKTDIKGYLGAAEFVQAKFSAKNGKQDISGVFNPALLPVLQPYSEAFGSQAKVQAAISRERRNLTFTAALTSKNLDINVDGFKTGNGYELPDLTITSRSPMIFAPDLPVFAEKFVFQGRANLEEIKSARGEMTVSGTAYEAYSIETISGPVAVSLEGQSVAFESDFKGKVSSKNLKRWSGEAPRIETAGRFNLEDKSVVLSVVSIRIPGLNLSAKGRADIPQKRANLDGTFTLAKTGLGLSTPAALSGRFKVRSDAKGLGVSMNGTARDFTEFPQPLETLIGETVKYDIKALITPSNMIEVQDMTVLADGLSVKGTGTFKPGGDLSANMTYDAQAFDINSLSVSGTSGEAGMSGRLDALEFDVAGRSGPIGFGPRGLSGAVYEVKGRKSPDGIIAAIDLSGENAAGSAALKAKASYGAGDWTLNQITSQVLGLLVSGDISGRGGSLENLKSDLDITGNLSQFIPAQTVDLAVSLANAAVVIKGEISDIEAGPLSAASLSIDALGPRDAVDISLNLKGQTELNDITRPLDLALNSRADLAGPFMSATSDVQGNIGLYDFTSAGPIVLAQTEKGLAGQGVIKTLGGVLSLALDDENSVLNFDGKGLTLASVLGLVGRPGVDGALDFTAEAARAAEGFKGQFEATLTNVRQPGSRGEPVNVNLEAALTEGNLTLTAQSQSETFSGQTQISGRLQTTGLPPFITWPPQKALSGQAAASGDIGTIAELFLPPETDVSGDLSLDMTYSFPLDVNGMNGTLTLNGGRFEQGILGVHLTDMAFKSVFSGLSLAVSDFSANGKKGGTLSGGGQMDLSDSGSGAITLTAKKLHVFDRQEGFATVSGNLDFTQTSETLKLVSQLNVDDANINVDKFPRAARPTLDVDFSDDAEQTPKKVRHTTDMDVSITSAGRIALRGRGINAALALDATVSGPFAAPVLKGEASIVRGRFDFLGKRFELADSRMIFGENIRESLLDVKAVRETADLTATINVTGTLERPHIELRSEPTLPEDEVLSYILFGRSAAQLTTLETARLATALAQLSGGGGFDLLGGLENSLGLDTLDFGTSESGQTQLKTGKYLSDNVYVEVRSSIEGSPGLAVEWTPRKNIAVEAETSPGETQRVSVQWQKDFD